MRALLCNDYGPPESLTFEDIDDPVAGANQVLVDIKAAAINFPDVLVIAGKYQVKLPPPFIPGNEAAGVIASLGEGVSNFKVGDKVIITTPAGGAFAEKYAADMSTVGRMPNGLSFEQGAGFTVTYSTSYHALKQCAQLQAGETVLVLGAAGGVGITAVELAKAIGANVIAAASSDEKLAFAKAAGADEVINYSRASLKDTVKEMTGGAGANVVYDPVGGELAQQAIRATARNGRYLVVGFASGDIPSFPANIALLKEASIIGVWWGPWAARNPREQLANVQQLSQLIADGSIEPRVDKSYAIDDFVAAFRAITERRTMGKVILRLTK
jgi:NADPH2:quinone reductase